MASRDYILCGGCGIKIIYDGYASGRDTLEEIWGDPKAQAWTVQLLCPDCIKALQSSLTQRQQELERVKAESEGRRVQLSVCSIERTAERKRAESAEAKVKELEAALREREAGMAELRDILVSVNSALGPYLELPKDRWPGPPITISKNIGKAIQNLPTHAKAIAEVVSAVKEWCRVQIDEFDTVTGEDLYQAESKLWQSATELKSLMEGKE